MKKSYTSEEWNEILAKMPDPKSKLKQEAYSLDLNDLRSRIKKRLSLWRRDDLVNRFQLSSKEKALIVYLWLLDLCDDIEHSWSILDMVKQQKKESFVPSL